LRTLDEAVLRELDSAEFYGKAWVLPNIADELAMTMALQKLLRWRAGRWEIASTGHRARLQAGHR